MLNFNATRRLLTRGAGSLFAAGAVLALLSDPSYAQVLLAFTPRDRTLPQGGTITFTGTLTNNSGAEIFIGNTSGTIDDPLTIGIDTSPFASNGPTSLAAGSSFTGDFFTATDNGAAPGTHPGAITINYGPTLDDAFNNSVDGTFGVVVTPAPAALPVFAVGGVIGLIATRRKKKNAEASSGE